MRILFKKWGAWAFLLLFLLSHGVWGQPKEVHPLLEEIQITREDLPSGYVLEYEGASINRNENTAVLSQNWDMISEWEGGKTRLEIDYTLYPTASEASEAARRWIEGLSLASMFKPKVHAPDIGDEVWYIGSSYPRYIRKGRVFIKINMNSKLYNHEKNKWERNPEAKLPINQVVNTIVSRIKFAGLDK